MEVSRIAAVMSSEGVRKGDVVTVYMPMVPELAMVMLACAKIGAIHSVVFAGFSAESLKYSFFFFFFLQLRHNTYFSLPLLLPLL